MHPVEDIGISLWPLDVVEFGADAYAHKKQVGVKQLYNQVPQMDWGESVRVPVAVGDNMPVEWEPAPDRGLGPSVTHGWAAQPRYERSAAMVRRTLDQYVAAYPRLQLTSHTQPTSSLSNKVWEVYFYKGACSFRSLKFVYYCWLCFRICLYICLCIV